MENKPRIAFCFSGQARTFDTTYPFFKVNLFDAAKEQWFEYDIFCAVEDDEDLEKIYVMNPTKVEKIKSMEVQKIIDEKYWDFIKESFNKKYFFHRLTKTTIPNFLQQVYKIKISNEIKNLYALENNIDYDIVIKLRFDLLFINKLDFILIDKVINNWKLIINKWMQEIIPIGDFFVFWNKKTMNEFSLIFDDFQNIFKWKELKWFLKIISSLFSNLYNIFMYIENKNIIFISKYSGYFIYIFWLFLNKIFFTPYTYEKIAFDNIMNKNLAIEYSSISYLLIRKNLGDSFSMLFNKSKFEL